MASANQDLEDPVDAPSMGASAGRSRGRGPWVVALVVALCFLAGSVGFVLGRGRPPGRDSADVGFLYDMLAHHEQAVDMAKLELADGAEEGVKVFAREVALFQSYEMGLMEATLEDWGYQRENPPADAMAWMGAPVPTARMPGMASEEDLVRLRDARGRESDAVFLDLLESHHQGGVHMGRAAASLVNDDDVRALAARFTRNQALEIDELRAARERYDLSRSG